MHRLCYDDFMKDREDKKAAGARIKKDFFLSLARSVKKKVKRMVLRRKRFLRVW